MKNFKQLARETICRKLGHDMKIGTFQLASLEFKFKRCSRCGKQRALARVETAAIRIQESE